jgi:hypothetical protein
MECCVVQDSKQPGVEQSYVRANPGRQICAGLNTDLVRTAPGDGLISATAMEYRKRVCERKPDLRI